MQQMGEADGITIYMSYQIFEAHFMIIIAIKRIQRMQNCTQDDAAVHLWLSFLLDILLGDA